MEALAAQGRCLDAAVEHRGRRGAAGARERRREALEALHDVEARAVGAPAAVHARRNDPQVDARELVAAERLLGHVDGDVRSGAQSPRSQSCETIRVPGASASRRGRSCRLTSGSRYIVTTVAAAEVGREQVLLAELDAVVHAGGAARSRLVRTRSGTISTPRPRRAEAARRGDDDAAVARAEVDDVIARRHARRARASPASPRRAWSRRAPRPPPRRASGEAERGGRRLHEAAEKRRATGAFAPCGRGLGGHGVIFASGSIRRAYRSAPRAGAREGPRCGKTFASR